MKKELIASVSSLLFPMAAYCLPTVTSGAYQRSYLRSSVSGEKPLSASKYNSKYNGVSFEPAWQQANTALQLDLQAGQAVNELIVIDEAVPGKHIFYRELKPGVDIVEIKAGQSGITQLEAILAQYHNLAAVHIVSHAEDGLVILGNTSLTTDAIKNRIELLSAINHSIKAGGDLLFYGCNLATGDAGHEFLDLLSQNTHADIAASNDTTGNAEQGGDWELEIQHGQIDSVSPFSEVALKEFSGVLAINDGTGKTITTAGFANGFGNTKSYDVDGSGYVLRLSTSSVSANAIYCDTGLGYCSMNFAGGIADIEQLYIEFTGGQPFDIDSMQVYTPVGNVTYVFTPSSGMPVTNNGFNVGFTTQTLNFSNITRLTIAREDNADMSGFDIDNLVIKNAASANAVPAIANFNGDSYTYTEGAGQTDIDQGTALTVADGDSADFNSGNLTVTITSGEDAAEDILSFNAASVTLAGSTANSDVTAGGAVIGTLGNNIAAGNDLVVNFNANATPARVQTLARAITYENTDTDNPTTGARNVRTTINDGDGGTSSNQDVTVTVEGQNDAPTISDLNTDSFSYSQGDGASNVDQGTAAVLADVDSTDDFNGGNLTVTITSGEDAAEDRLSVDGTVTLGGMTAGSSVTVGGFNIGTLGNNISAGNDFVVNLNVNATLARVQTLVRAVTYENTDVATATTGTRNVRLTVNDGDGGTSSNQDVSITVTVPDSDGSLTSAAPVTEPVALPWSVDTVGEAVDLFDFTLTDGGTADGLPMTISQVVVNVTGSANDTDRAKVTWRLDSNAPNNDVNNVTGVYNAGANTITFSGLSISIADGSSEILTVNGYYNDNTGLTNGNTIILSVDGDTDLTVGNTNTQMAATSAVNNGTGTVILDNIAPVVNSVTVPGNSTYTLATDLNFTVNFNENVDVNTVGGTPRLTLTVGATTRYASFVSGTGTSALVFRYTVPAGDEDLNGIALAANLDPNLGTLRDSAGNNINTTLNSVGALTSVFVDALAPVVAEVTPVVTPGADSTPNVTFSNTESGTLAVGGACGSGDEGVIGTGNQTITLTQTDNSTALTSGTYTNCTVTVTDSAGNVSNVLTLSSFSIDVTDPTVDTNGGRSLDEGDTGVGIANTDLSSSDNVSAAANVTYTLVAAPSNGTLRNGGGALAGGGTFTQANIDASAITYDHDGSETLSDTFTFTVTDAAGNVNNNGAANFTFNFTVATVNDPPSTTVDTDTTNEDNAVMVDVLANDSDVDGSLNAASVVVVSAASNGGTSVNMGTGVITYTPNADFEGMDSFTYTVADNNALVSAATAVTITVNAQNDPPVAVADPVSTPTDTLIAIDVAANDTDVDAGDNPDPTTIVVVGAASSGSAVFNGGTNRVDYTPNGGFTGVDSFTYTIDDGVGATSNVATVTITVADPVDTDGDGISDVQEGIDGTNPNDPNDYLDVVDPVITAPADIVIDATGLFTAVTLRQLLGLNASASNALLQQALEALATDNADGANCCNATALGLSSNQVLLVPGAQTVTWRATDRKGNTDEDTQTVNIRPMVSVNVDQTSVEGAAVTFKVLLNGLSPFYPLTVPYIIDAGNSTATAPDHDLVDGSVMFTAGQSERLVTINLVDDATPEGDEVLVVALDDQTTNEQDLLGGYNPANINDINAGSKISHAITITEANVAPIVSLRIQQNAINTSMITAADGAITATATVTDPNVGDTQSYDWSGSDTVLMDTDGDLADETFVFDPTGLIPGRQRLSVTVTDSGGAVQSVTLYFRVVDTLPVLSLLDDSDNDGTNDQAEGSGDSDDDGIPDYLDNISALNVLPETTTDTGSFLIECDPGVRCRLGRFSLLSGSGGARLDQDDIDTQTDLTEDEATFTQSGGIFDFEINDLAVAGQVVRVAIPLQEAIPADAIYRKFSNGQWSTFVEDANNALHSSPGLLGYCPPPGDASWEVGLIEGYNCAQLTLEDGGPNDADGMANRSIEDPGGVATAASEAVIEVIGIRSNVKGGGGSIGVPWLMLLGLFAMQGRTRGNRQRKMLLSICALFLMVTSTQSRAFNWSEHLEKSYLELNIYQADGSQSRGDLVNGLAADGVTANVSTYDITRQAFQLSAGYQYHSYFSFEFGYLDLGELTINLDASVTNTDGLAAAISNNYPVSGEGWTLANRFHYPFGEQFSGSVKAGIFIWDGDINVNVANVNADLKDDIDPLLELSLHYHIQERYIVNLNIERIFFDDEKVDLIGLGFAWWF